jgi:hypothetical protein
MSSAATALVLVLLLQIKHFACDGPLQTKEMVHAKGIYGKPLGILHSAIHGAGTFVVFAATGFSWTTVLLFAAVDFIIHYHIDFTKENIVRYFGWSMAVPYFWWMIALDQLLHHVTYIALVAYSQDMF